MAGASQPTYRYFSDGGLLSVSQPMVQGSEVKMIFLTGTGQCWEARKCFSRQRQFATFSVCFAGGGRSTATGELVGNGRLRKTRAGMDGEAEGGVGAAERAAALASKAAERLGY